MQASGAHLPPIKGFLETSFLDWPKKLVSVIFLPYCNFRCPFCQNSTLVIDPERLETIPIPYVLERLQKLKGWMDGICITGGEPTVHPLLPELTKLFKRNNLPVKLDTNGSNPEMLENLLTAELIDCVSMDVKAPLKEDRYSRLIGVRGDLKKVRESIDILQASTIEVQFRITVVPGMLTEEDIYDVARDLSSARYFTIQQFSPENTLEPRLRDVLPWPQGEIDRIQKVVNTMLGTG